MKDMWLDGCLVTILALLAALVFLSLAALIAGGVKAFSTVIVIALVLAGIVSVCIAIVSFIF